MKVQLYIDSDTCLTFKSRAAAFIYCEKNNLQYWMLLTTGYENGTVSVFNPFLIVNGEQGGVEYLKSETEALKYIGNFLTN